LAVVSDEIQQARFRIVLRPARTRAEERPVALPSTAALTEAAWRVENPRSRLPETRMRCFNREPAQVSQTSLTPTAGHHLPVLVVGRSPVASTWLAGICALGFVLGSLAVPLRGEELAATSVPLAEELADDAGCECCAQAIGVTANSFFVQADALLLKRVPRSLNQPVVLDTPGATLLTTRDADLPFQVGPRLVMGFAPDECRSWEGVYFGTHSWHGTAAVQQANGLRIPGDLALASLDFLFADQMRIDYSAQLHNVEINRWWHRGTVSWLAGFRYVNLDEEFNIHAQDFNTGGSDYRIEADNNLFGGQLGARLAGCRGRFAWDATGKVGVFGNAGRQHSFVGDFDNTFVLRDTGGRRNNAAMVADISLNAEWRLCDTWSVRGGYHLMWVEGVVLAPDQLDFTDTPLSGSTVDNGGGIFLHGAYVGLAAGW
jgi:hypothetical protein